MRKAIVFCLLLVGIGPLCAATRFESGPGTVDLVELYTSEGCSSCPPADAALSRLLGADGLWTRFVPVAFHVGYWDHLGWEDRFAEPAYARRQRAYADSWGHGVVYTPGVVLQGREWRSRDIAAGLARLPENDRAGRLDVRVDDDGTARVSYRAPGGAASLSVHAALLGFDLTTAIGAGENAGRTLRHDFVALEYRVRAMTRRNGKAMARVRLPIRSGEADRLALAVWVSREDSPAPLQAAGGWLSGPTASGVPTD